MIYSQKDIEQIRSLAERIVTIAKEPRMEAIKKRWADVNALRKPDRAPVWCKPVGCWNEIITDSMLKCTDPWLRQIEYNFLQIIHKRDIDDDHPVEEFFEINAAFSIDPKNTWGVDIGRHYSDTELGTWAYAPPITSKKDLNKLQYPKFSYCKEQTQNRKARIEDLLGDIMPVKITAEPLLSATLGTAAADLRGLEQMMMDMIAEPDVMHHIMSYLRDVNLSALDQLEECGILTQNNIGPMTCSDPVGKINKTDKLLCRNLWCMANSQEFDQVSPAMWEEFCLNYQKPIFERFGYVGYGCCENLTHKIDGILTIPNLRIFTCSAWTDLMTVLEKVGRDYCIMWRQKASDVVFPDDPIQIQKNLMDGVKQLKGHYYQIVLRELQTLAGHRDRLHEWTRYAKEAAEKYS